MNVTADPAPEEQRIALALDKMQALRVPIIMSGILTSLALLLAFTLIDLLKIPSHFSGLITTLILVGGMLSIFVYSHRKYQQIPDYMRFLATHRWQLPELHTRRQLSKELKEILIAIEKETNWSNYFRLCTRHLPTHIKEPEQFVAALQHFASKYPHIWQSYLALEPLNDKAINHLNRDRRLTPFVLQLLRLQVWVAVQRGIKEPEMQLLFGNAKLESEMDILIQKQISSIHPDSRLIQNLNALLHLLRKHHHLGLIIQVSLMFLILTGIQYARLPEWIYSLTMMVGLLALLLFVAISRTMTINTLKNRREVAMLIGWVLCTIAQLNIVLGFVIWLTTVQRT